MERNIENQDDPLKPMFSALRFLPLVLPLLSLALAFMQQSTGFLDALLSVLHLFSNPIDALWSILCRQEAIHRSYLFTMRYLADVAREMTAILAIYDPWQDCHSKIKEALRARPSVDNGIITQQEKLLIRLSSRRIRACRNDGTINATSATATYIFSVAIVCWKVAQSDQQGAADVLCFVAVFAHLLLAIRINGRTGTFVYHDEAIRVVFELCDELEAVAVDSRLTLLHRPAVDAEGSDDWTDSSPRYIDSLNSLGYASGRLNCVYPWKTGFKVIPALAIVVSCSGAMIFSVFTDGSTRSTLAVGCLSLWVFNCLLSSGTAALLKGQRISTKTYSRLLLVADLVIASGLVSCASFSINTQPAKVDTGIVDMITWQGLLLLQMMLLYALEAWSQLNIDIRHIFVRSSDEALADHEATLSLA